MNTQIGGLDHDAALAKCAQIRARIQPAAPISLSEYGQRLERARALMREHGVDALLVSAGTSLRYFAGIPWGATERLVGLVITATGAPVAICPVFEEGSFDAVLKIPVEKRLWEEHEDPYLLVAGTLRERGARTLALDPGASFAIHSGLCRHLAAGDITDATVIIDSCRMAKSAAELALIQQASDMAQRWPVTASPPIPWCVLSTRRTVRSARTMVRPSALSSTATRPPIRTAFPACSSSIPANWC